MEYRNSGNATHLSANQAVGVGSSAGVELGGGSTAGTITAIGDATNENLRITAKGTGNLSLGDSSNVVFINGSTTPFKLVVGQSTTTLPNMPANSLDVSTMAAAGISTGDLILFVDARGVLSTEVGMAGYTCTAANEICVRWINPHASSITAETTGVTMRWAYIDRT